MHIHITYRSHVLCSAPGVSMRDTVPLRNCGAATCEECLGRADTLTHELNGHDCIYWLTNAATFRRTVDTWTTAPGATVDGRPSIEATWVARENAKRYRRTSERHTLVWACHMAGRGELEPTTRGES